MPVLHIIILAALLGWIVFVLALLTIFGAANRAERIAEGWDEWDQLDDAEQPRLRVIAIDADGEYHATMNDDDSITLDRPFDWAGDAA